MKGGGEIPGVRWAAVLIIAGLGHGCGSQPPGDDLRPQYAVGFVTADLSTGSPWASLRITYGAGDVPMDVVDMFAAKVRMTAWPQGNNVDAAFSNSTSAGGQLTGGGQIQAYGLIDVRPDDSLPRAAWYAISIADLPTGSYVLDNGDLVVFADGSRGIRISPAHGPVVASVLWCDKGGSETAVYVRFSESVTGSGGAVALDVAGTGVTCALGAEAITETQFICTGAAITPQFSVQIGDSITAQFSGTPMAATTLPSSAMQMAARPDGCVVFKPLSTD